MRRAYAYYRKGDLDHAITDSNDAIGLNPRFAIAYLVRGMAYQGKHDLERAAADYDDALRLDPASAKAYSLRGDMYRERHDFDRAIADYNEAIQIEPNNAGIHLDRAAAYLQKGDFDHAMADYNDLIRFAPRSRSAAVSLAGVYRGRGIVQVKEHEFDLAISDFNEAIELDPNSAYAYGNRAEARARKGDLQGAFADSETAIHLDEKSASPHAYRAYIFAKMGQFDRAFAEIAEAFKLDNNSFDAFLYRGELYLIKGQLQQARPDFEAALAKYPHDPFALAGRDAAGPVLAASQPRSQTAAPALSVLAPPMPSAPSDANKRVALVIGNGAYRSVPALPNPARDAEAIAAMFRAAGFSDVRKETNVGVAAMRRALRDFADTAADADTAVVFFAGHGIEIGGRNYLIPADAKLAADLDVEDEAVDLDRVLQLLDPVRRLKLVILDACRDNPFASHIKLTVASRSIGRGLAQPDQQASNTLVAFAARAGAIADDGNGRNSPFTTALLHNLTRPGLDVRIALGEVHDEVLAATGRRQEPYIYGALGGGTLPLAPETQPAH